MTDADRELAELLKRNPELRVVEHNQAAATMAQKHAITQRTKELLAEPMEDEMQAAVIAWAEAQSHPALRWLFHTPNGEYRAKATLGRLSKMGINSGVPDLLLPWRTGDYVGLAIEMKRRPNKPSAEQLQWLAHLEAQGWRTEVCYSADSAIQVLRNYLDIT